jgi:hypothetical protein
LYKTFSSIRPRARPIFGFTDEFNCYRLTGSNIPDFGICFSIGKNSIITIYIDIRENSANTMKHSISSEIGLIKHNNLNF